MKIDKRSPRAKAYDKRMNKTIECPKKAPDCPTNEDNEKEDTMDRLIDEGLQKAKLEGKFE